MIQPYIIQTLLISAFRVSAFCTYPFQTCASLGHPNYSGVKVFKIYRVHVVFVCSTHEIYSCRRQLDLVIFALINPKCTKSVSKLRIEAPSVANPRAFAIMEKCKDIQILRIKLQNTVESIYMPKDDHRVSQRANRNITRYNKNNGERITPI